MRPDPIAFFWSLTLFLMSFVFFILSQSAQAQMVIEICGGSNYTCRTPTSATAADTGYLGTRIDNIKVTDPTTGKTADIALSPYRAFPTPPGWTPAAPGSIDPTPPSTATQTYTYSAFVSASGVTVTGGTPADTAGAFCTEFLRHYHANGAPLMQCISRLGAYPKIEYASCQTTGCTPVYASVPASVGYSTTTVCPAGYTASGANCNLSNASIVQKPSDGHCPIARVANMYASDPNDPDCTAAADSAKTVTGLSATSGTSTAGGSTGPSTSIVVAGDGTATITIAQPYGGSTTTYVYKAGAPAGAGVVTGSGYAVSTSAGTGSVNAPSTPVEHCGGPGQPQCDVRVNEAGTPSGSGAYSAATSALDSASAARETAIGNLAGSGKVTTLPGFSFPSFLPTAGTCTALHWDFKGYVYDHDWCPMLARLRALWAWVIGIIGALYVWRRATSPNA